MAEEQTPVGVEPRGGFSLLWGMVVRPRSTLEYLRDSGGRTWLVVAILTVVLVTLPILIGAPIRARQTREAVLAAQEQGGQDVAEMSAEEQAQMEQALSMAASPLITTVFPSVMRAVGLVAGWLIWAGALYLAGTALGGRCTFGQVFRLTVWAWIPHALRGLLQSIYILLSGQLIVNPGLSGFVVDNSTVGELAFARPGLGQLVLAGFLSRVDLFLFWNLALLTLGVLVATRLPRRKAVLATLGVWVLLTGLGLVPNLIGGLLAQQFGG